MGKQTNTGYADFIGNVRFIIDMCKQHGVKYNPSNPKIAISAMTAKCDEALGLHQAYQEGLAAASVPIAERMVKFERMKKIVRRTIVIYACSDTMKSSVEHARGLVRKITGSNVRVQRLANGMRDPKHISNCHMDYATMAANFSWLVAYYKGDPLYAPNEVDLQTASLEALLAELEAVTSSVNEWWAKLIFMRSARDRSMFEEETGLYDIMLACKSYMKGLFGPRSDEARSVTRIFLRRLARWTV